MEFREAQEVLNSTNKHGGNGLFFRGFSGWSGLLGRLGDYAVIINTLESGALVKAGLFAAAPLMTKVYAVCGAIAIGCRLLGNASTARNLRGLPTEQLQGIQANVNSPVQKLKAGFFVPGSVRRVVKSELSKRAKAAAFTA